MMAVPDTDWEGGSHRIIEVENDASHHRNQGQQKEWQAGVGEWVGGGNLLSLQNNTAFLVP